MERPSAARSRYSVFRNKLSNAARASVAFRGTGGAAVGGGGAPIPFPCAASRATVTRVLNNSHVFA